MKDINPYLVFNGTCAAAMKFYQNVFGGTLDIRTFENSPEKVPQEVKDKVMHARLEIKGMILMASDVLPDHPVIVGNNITLYINCETASQAEAHFKALSQGGSVAMPLQDTFWGAKFGMTTDQFGIQWMINFDKTQP